jgi:hypothetical protein
MPWKCPQCGADGLDDGLSSHAVDAGGCGFSKFPAGVVLTSAASGKELSVRLPTMVGQAVLRRLAPDECKYASTDQFRVDKSPERGGWVVYAIPYAANPTYLNGAPIPADGQVLKAGDSLSIKGKYLLLSVSLTG